MVRVDATYRVELENRISWQLDQASLKELMIPSFSHTFSPVLLSIFLHSELDFHLNNLDKERGELRGSSWISWKMLLALSPPAWHSFEWEWVLFSEQTKLHCHIDWSGSFNSLRSPNGGLDPPGRCLSKREMNAQQMEIRKLKEDVYRLQSQFNSMQVQKKKAQC
ncbi:hypothetical protein JHK87_041015 [Glycine soja]|nr:hypothetical protein JHK87_041015 [Glycine soja]